MEPGAARIVLLLDKLETDYQLEVIQGVRRVLARAAARLVVVLGGALGTDQAPNDRNFVYDYLREGRIDGLIVLSGSISNVAGVARLQQFLGTLPRIPMLTIGVNVEGIPGISVDNRAGMKALVAHLVDVHGARRLAFAQGPVGSSEAQARFRGFEEALSEAGIELRDEWLVPGGFLREDGMTAVDTLLSERGIRTTSLDALVCVNDESALGAMEALAKRGIAVPKPLAVVGFDDAPAAQISNPPLSTTSQSVMAQAEAAGRMLLDYLARGTPLASKTIQAAVVIRDSCGCRTRAQNDSRSLAFERPKVARTLKLALIERRAAIVSQMTRAARGRMAGVHDWEGRLLDALSAQVDTDEGGAFYWELERLTRVHCTNAGDPIVCHDVLTELRLQTLVCGEVEPTSRPRVEDIFQEGRLILARVSSSVAREQVEARSTRMRHFTQACLSQVGRPDERALGEMLAQELPLMGIQSYCVTRSLPDDQGLLVIAARGVGLRGARPTVLATKSLGHDPELEKAATTLLLPLSYQGHRLGTATFAWGSTDPLGYEEIRELLSLALYALASNPMARV